MERQMKNNIRTVLATTLLAMSVSSAFAAAPERTECIAPAKPGGGFDLTCKLLQVSMQETGQITTPMRVTYMPGGVGAVAYNAIIAQRPAEAGTVVAYSGGSLLNLSQGKFGRYTVDDVKWLAAIGTDYGMVAVRNDAPWQNLGELMEAMKKDPTKVVVGAGASIGSQDWMKTALLAREGGIDPRKMRYVAFEGGGEPVTALLGNHIQVVSGDMSEMVPHLQSGKLRVLAVMADQRLPGELAQVPTAKEQGFNVSWPIIRGYYLGPKVSDADYQWWEAAFKKLVTTKEFQQQRDMRGLFEFNLFGSELDSYVKKQVADYREQAKSFGLAK
ncbi:tricarboxylic transporter [Pantoea cypripedii]|uniref:Tricarboxylic transporter n=2 Tax=Pantoea cypripedii TaxID=55209 RepID=A0A6B9GBA7_PANCY|nr:tripartite tricarboxylate transporter substrate binding protein [Pantoea cypripedii]QGY30015.1 tricarboxylic transporter [Pantoea cypripedii]